MEPTTTQEDATLQGLPSSCLHSAADTNYYCETCRKALCPKCFQTHSSHIVFNLTAVARTISEQLDSAAANRDTYREVLAQCEKAETELAAAEGRSKEKAAAVLDHAKREVDAWLEQYTRPVSTLLGDVRRRKEETEGLLKAVEVVIAEKAAIQSEIQTALAEKQYLKIYNRKNAMVSAFLSEAQLAALREKAAGIARKLDVTLSKEMNVEELNSSVTRLMGELRTAEWRDRAASSVFSISPKAAKADIIDIKTRRRLTVNIGLSIEGFDAVLLGPSLYIVGGLATGGQYLRSCVEFDLSSAGECKPRQRAELANERVAHTIQNVCGEYIYCVGGYNPTLKYLKQCEKFEVRLNRWVALPNMNEHKSQVSMCCLEDRFLYIFGGSIGPSKWLRTIEMLDLSRECFGWRLVKYSSPSEPQWTGSYCAGCVAVSDTQVLLFGGMQQEKTGGCFLFDQVSMQGLDRALESEASFYQRKSLFLDGAVYAVSLSGDLHLEKEAAVGDWRKCKLADFAESSSL